MPPAVAFGQEQRAEHVHQHAAYRAMDTALGIGRIALGAIFLWAFVDKLFGLGFSTVAAKSWLQGGSPSKGYLGSAVGPLADFYHAIAGHPVTDALFMLGLAGVGLALILGIGVRIAGYAGAAMMILMFSSHPVWALNPAPPHPFLDDHIIYAIVLVAFALGNMGRHVGMGNAWRHVKMVQRFPWLE